MNRRQLVSLHLYCSSFFAAMLIMAAVSGGGYLLGYKGEFPETEIGTLSTEDYAVTEGMAVDDVLAILAAAGVTDYDFEYSVQRGDTLVTRPTSRRHFRLAQRGGALQITEVQPNLQASLVELHKGHGPQNFKTLSKFLAAGLLFIMITGVWLGLSSPALRRSTALSVGLGVAVFIRVPLPAARMQISRGVVIGGV